MKNFKLKLLAGALALTCVSSCSCTVVYESKDTNTSDLSSTTTAPEEDKNANKTPVELPTDEELAAVVATIGEVEITAAEYYFFLYELAEMVVAQNGSYLTMYGGELPDYKYSLKSQYIMSDTTWHDYLKKDMPGYLEYIYLVAEAGKKAGITLTDEELHDVEHNAEEFKAPDGVPYLTKELAKKCYEVSALADKYRKYIEETNPDATDDEITAEFEANKKLYTLVELNYFPIAYTDGTETGTEENATLTKDKAQAYADRLNACTTTEQFKAVVEEIVKEITPDATKEEIEYYVEGCAYAGLAYEEGFDILDWAFANERKDGDITVIDSAKDKTLHTGLLIKAPYTDESKTATVRHILVEEEAKAKEILDEFNASDKTAEKFGELAEKYTTDEGSASTGGLYENFGEGEMVTEFNDWAFDEKRVTGDVEIVKTSYGYHIMYFVEKGLPKYLANVKNTVETAKIDAIYDQMEKDFKLEINEDFTKALDI